MNPTNMLELQKLVLENVYENKLLFEKELRKSFQWLGYEELLHLYYWATGKFNEQYCNIIDCVFKGFDFQNVNPFGSLVKNKVISQVDDK
jgi:hypothetical protein